MSRAGVYAPVDDCRVAARAGFYLLPDYRFDSAGAVAARLRANNPLRATPVFARKRAPTQVRESMFVMRTSVAVRAVPASPGLFENGRGR